MTTIHKFAVLIAANLVTLLIKIFTGPGLCGYTMYNVLNLPTGLLILMLLSSSVFYILVLIDFSHYKIIRVTIPALLIVMICNQIAPNSTSWIVFLAFMISLITFVYLGIYAATHYNNRYMLQPLVALAGFVFLNNIGFHFYYIWPLQVLLAQYFVFYRLILLIVIYILQVIAYYKISDMHVANTHRKTIEYNE
ncbi:MAG: hypothetical protein UMR38_05025 [Candidatus Izemoplasma sp.]|nr:hypothetical protein [Candidatus Izemoplasma sp.]